MDQPKEILMACEVGREKLDAYLDGELLSVDASALSAHMRICTSCAADALERVRMKRAVAAAGKRYESSAEFRKKIAGIAAAKTSTAQSPRKFNWVWILATPALLVLILSVAVNNYVGRETARRLRVYSELADLHVATLASATPVDVLSTDRHTVKPWFQGKIPFTFNLPELQGTDFTLIGGRVSYLAQSPGAQLVYQIRKHEISVFIFQDRGAETSLPATFTNVLSFNTDTWSRNGLHYFIIGDVSPSDIQALSKLLQNAG
jgi:anti-sigma factor RsiW